MTNQKSDKQIIEMMKELIKFAEENPFRFDLLKQKLNIELREKK